MKQLITSVIFSFISLVLLSQEDTIPEPVKPWKLESIFGLNGTQSSFVNWSAGGRNNVSALAFINASAYYTKDLVKWDTDLKLALGGLRYIGAGAGQETIQKTDDKIDLATKLGLKINEVLYPSIVAGFKTQFLDGFANPGDTVRASMFMAPGYLNLGLGMDYRPNDHLTAFLSPLAGKVTMVMDSQLANAGAFGVTAAEYDPLTGTLTKDGEHFRYEFGAYLKLRYNKEILKNVNMTYTMDLFSNYLDRPQNIDVNADLLFNLKVNSWLSASVNWTLMYDHDIMITDSKGGIGPRTQFKSVIGVGITYKLKNY